MIFVTKKLPYTREVLGNGLTALLYPMKESQAAGLSLKFHAGTYFESESGLAHAVEHFLYLATEKFPSERVVREKLEELGARWNGRTAGRYIELWLQIPAKNLEAGLELLSEIAFSPVFLPETLEKERSVVIQEWKKRHDQPHFRFFQKLRETRLTTSHHPYIRDESLALLEGFSLDDISSFYGRYFQPQQAVLGVGGGIESGKTLKLIKRYFGEQKKGKVIPEPVFETDSYASRTVVCHQEKSSQAEIEINFPAFGWREYPYPVREAAQMANRIIGGSVVSRLWRSLREDRGWVYHVESNLTSWPYLGIFSVNLSCDVARLAEVMEVVRDDINGFLSDGPKEREVELAREFLLGRLATGFETSLGVAEYLVDEEFDQEGIWLPKDRMEVVSSISKKEIWDMSQKVVDWGRVQVGLMNDFQNTSKTEFESMVERTF